MPSSLKDQERFKCGMLVKIKIKKKRKINIMSGSLGWDEAESEGKQGSA